MSKYFRSFLKLLPIAFLNVLPKFRADHEIEADHDTEIEEIKISINKIFLTS